MKSLSESNIFNRPLKASLLVSVVGLAGLIYVAVSVFSFVSEKTNTGFYIGIGFIADLLTVIYGYLGIILVFVLGCVNYYLAYSSKGCDMPNVSVALRVFACVVMFSAVALSAVYTYKVILLYICS